MLTVLFAVFAATAAPAKAQGPDFFIIHCQGPDGSQLMVPEATDPRDIATSIAVCHANGGHVSGVEAIFR